MKFFNLFRSILLTILISIFNAEARWATIEDASVQVEFINNTISVNEEGKESATIEKKVKILNESGRSEYANYRITYNGDAAKLKVLEAYTIYNGKKYPVSFNALEDKPLASANQGFDQKRQVLISFPNIEVGAEAYLKYTFEETEIPIDQFYNLTLTYGSSDYIMASNTTIKSKLPLHIKVNDPKNILKITKDKEDNFYKAEIILQKPNYEEIINESGLLKENKLTWISISTETDWKEVAKKLSKGYQKVLDQELPKILQDIVNEAKDIKEPIEQMNKVMATLNEKIQYIGDWRSVKGKMYPRDLDVIAESQVADCKEFSVSAGVILKKLGYKAQPAAVLRGSGSMSYEHFLPNLGNFNHIFLKVTDKEGKIYWIDPTNMISMAQAIFPDVAEKRALVLDYSDPSYEVTPAVDYKKSSIEKYVELEFTKDNQTINTGYMKFKGQAAMDFTGIKLYRSDQYIRDSAFYSLSGIHLDEEDKKDLQLPDLSSRIVKDLEFKFKFVQRDRIIKTNMGRGLDRKYTWLEELFNNAPDQVSERLLGTPFSFKITYIFKNTKLKNIHLLNYEQNSPWMNVKRSCSYEGKDSKVEEVIEFKKRIISNEELQTKEYKDFKKAIFEDLKTVIILD